MKMMSMIKNLFSATNIEHFQDPTKYGIFKNLFESISLGNILQGLVNILFRLVYLIVSFILNVVDFVQFFIEKLVGIDFWGRKEFSLEGLSDSDVIFRFIQNDTVARVFKYMLGVFAVLLIVFTIIAIVKNEYEYASGTTDKMKDVKGVLKKSLKAIILVILVPVLLVMGILASNAILASLVNAFNVNNKLSLGGQIFVTSAYDANRYREYAEGNERYSTGYQVAVTVDGVTKHIDSGLNAFRPREYKNKVYSGYLIKVNGETYLYTVPSSELTANYKFYEKYITEHLGAAIVSPTSGEFTEKYADDMQAFGLGTQAIKGDIFDKAEGEILNVVYNTWYYNEFLTRQGNKFDDTLVSKDVKFEARSHHTFTARYYYNNLSWGALHDGGSTEPTINHAGLVTSVNTGYVAIPEEYLVMADIIDFMISDGATLNMVAIDNPLIDWSYGNPHREYRYFNNDYIGSNATGVSYPSQFMVSYKNRGNVLYTPNFNANDEIQGATFIMAYCKKLDDGSVSYVPVVHNRPYYDENSKTEYTFKSSGLDSSYNGLVVARGVLNSDIRKYAGSPTRIVGGVTEIATGKPLSSVDNVYTNVSMEANSVYAQTAVDNSIAFKTDALDLPVWVDYETFAENGNFINGQGGSYKIAQKSAGEVFEGMMGQDVLNLDFIGTLGKSLPTSVSLLVNDSLGSSADRVLDSLSWAQIGQANILDAEGDDSASNAAGGAGDVYYMFRASKSFKTYSNDTRYLYALVKKYTGATYGDNMIDVVYFSSDASYTSANDNLVFNLASNSNKIVVGDKSGADYGYVISYNKDSKVDHINPTTITLLEMPASKVYYNDKDGGVFKYSEGKSFVYTEDKYGIFTYTVEMLDARVDGTSSDVYGQIGFKNVLSSMSIGATTVTAVDLHERTADRKETDSAYFFYYYNNSASNPNVLEVRVDKATKVATLMSIDSYNIYVGATKMGSAVSFEDFEFVRTDTISGVKQNLYRVKVGSEFYYVYLILDNIGTTIIESDYASVIEDNRYQMYSFAARSYSSFDYISKADGRTYKYNQATHTSALSSGSTLIPSHLLNLEYTEFANETYAQGMYTYDVYIYDDANDLFTGEKVLVAQMTYKTRNRLPWLADLSSEQKHGYMVDFESLEVDSNSYEVLPLYSSVDLAAKFTNTTTSKIEFVREKIRLSVLQSDIKIDITNIFTKGKVFRFKISFWDTVESPEEDRLGFSLGAEGFFLNYNFDSVKKLTLNTFYIPGALNIIILVLATALVFKVMAQSVWGLVRRIYDIVIYMLIMPAVASTMPLDDKRFTTWKDNLVGSVLGAYGVMIGLNFFFIMMDPIRDASQMFKDGDLEGALAQGNWLTFLSADTINKFIYLLFLLVALTLIQSLPGIITALIGKNAKDYYAEGEKVKKGVESAIESAGNFWSGKDLKNSIEYPFKQLSNFVPGSAFFKKKDDGGGGGGDSGVTEAMETAGNLMTESESKFEEGDGINVDFESMEDDIDIEDVKVDDISEDGVEGPVEETKVESDEDEEGEEGDEDVATESSYMNSGIDLGDGTYKMPDGTIRDKDGKIVEVKEDLDPEELAEEAAEALGGKSTLLGGLAHKLVGKVAGVKDKAGSFLGNLAKNGVKALEKAGVNPEDYVSEDGKIKVGALLKDSGKFFKVGMGALKETFKDMKKGNLSGEVNEGLDKVDTLLDKEDLSDEEKEEVKQITQNSADYLQSYVDSYDSDKKEYDDRQAQIEEDKKQLENVGLTDEQIARKDEIKARLAKLGNSDKDQEERAKLEEELKGLDGEAIDKNRKAELEALGDPEEDIKKGQNMMDRNLDIMETSYMRGNETYEQALARYDDSISKASGKKKEALERERANLMRAHERYEQGRALKEQGEQRKAELEKINNNEETRRNLTAEIDSLENKQEKWRTKHAISKDEARKKLKAVNTVKDTLNGITDLEDAVEDETATRKELEKETAKENKAKKAKAGGSAVTTEEQKEYDDRQAQIEAKKSELAKLGDSEEDKAKKAELEKQIAELEKEQDEWQKEHSGEDNIVNLAGMIRAIIAEEIAKAVQDGDVDKLQETAQKYTQYALNSNEIVAHQNNIKAEDDKQAEWLKKSEELKAKMNDPKRRDISHEDRQKIKFDDETGIAVTEDEELANKYGIALKKEFDESNKIKSDNQGKIEKLTNENDNIRQEVGFEEYLSSEEAFDRAQLIEQAYLEAKDKIENPDVKLEVSDDVKGMVGDKIVESVENGNTDELLDASALYDQLAENLNNISEVQAIVDDLKNQRQQWAESGNALYDIINDPNSGISEEEKKAILASTKFDPNGNDIAVTTDKRIAEQYGIAFASELKENSDSLIEGEAYLDELTQSKNAIKDKLGITEEVSAEEAKERSSKLEDAWVETDIQKDEKKEEKRQEIQDKIEEKQSEGKGGAVSQELLARLGVIEKRLDQLEGKEDEEQSDEQLEYLIKESAAQDDIIAKEEAKIKAALARKGEINEQINGALVGGKSINESIGFYDDQIAKYDQLQAELEKNLKINEERPNSREAVYARRRIAEIKKQQEKIGDRDELEKKRDILKTGYTKIKNEDKKILEADNKISEAKTVKEGLSNEIYARRNEVADQKIAGNKEQVDQAKAKAEEFEKSVPTVEGMNIDQSIEHYNKKLNENGSNSEILARIAALQKANEAPDITEEDKRKNEDQIAELRAKKDENDHIKQELERLNEAKKQLGEYQEAISKLEVEGRAAAAEKSQIAKEQAQQKVGELNEKLGENLIDGKDANQSLDIYNDVLRQLANVEEDLANGTLTQEEADILTAKILERANASSKEEVIEKRDNINNIKGEIETQNKVIDDADKVIAESDKDKEEKDQVVDHAKTADIAEVSDEVKENKMHHDRIRSEIRAWVEKSRAYASSSRSAAEASRVYADIANGQTQKYAEMAKDKKKEPKLSRDERKLKELEELRDKRLRDQQEGKVDTKLGKKDKTKAYEEYNKGKSEELQIHDNSKLSKEEIRKKALEFFNKKNGTNLTDQDLERNKKLAKTVDKTYEAEQEARKAVARNNFINKGIDDEIEKVKQRIALKEAGLYVSPLKKALQGIGNFFIHRTTDEERAKAEEEKAGLIDKVKKDKEDLDNKTKEVNERAVQEYSKDKVDENGNVVKDKDGKAVKVPVNDINEAFEIAKKRRNELAFELNALRQMGNTSGAEYKQKEKELEKHNKTIDDYKDLQKRKKTIENNENKILKLNDKITSTHSGLIPGIARLGRNGVRVVKANVNRILADKKLKEIKDLEKDLSGVDKVEFNDEVNGKKHQLTKDQKKKMESKSLQVKSAESDLDTYLNSKLEIPPETKARTKEEVNKLIDQEMQRQIQRDGGMDSQKTKETFDKIRQEALKKLAKIETSKSDFNKLLKDYQFENRESHVKTTNKLYEKKLEYHTAKRKEYVDELDRSRRLGTLTPQQEKDLIGKIATKDLAIEQLKNNIPRYKAPSNIGTRIKNVPTVLVARGKNVVQNIKTEVKNYTTMAKVLVKDKVDQVKGKVNKFAEEHPTIAKVVNKPVTFIKNIVNQGKVILMATKLAHDEKVAERKIIKEQSVLVKNVRVKKVVRERLIDTVKETKTIREERRRDTNRRVNENVNQVKKAKEETSRAGQKAEQTQINKNYVDGVKKALTELGYGAQATSVKTPEQASNMSKEISKQLAAQKSALAKQLKAEINRRVKAGENDATIAEATIPIRQQQKIVDDAIKALNKANKNVTVANGNVNIVGGRVRTTNATVATTGGRVQTSGSNVSTRGGSVSSSSSTISQVDLNSQQFRSSIQSMINAQTETAFKRAYKNAYNDIVKEATKRMKEAGYKEASSPSKAFDQAKLYEEFLRKMRHDLELNKSDTNTKELERVVRQLEKLQKLNQVANNNIKKFNKSLKDLMNDKRTAKYRKNLHGQGSKGGVLPDSDDEDK